METRFSDLDAGGVLLFAEEALRARRQGECDDLRLAACWADLHAEDPKSWPKHRQFPGMPRLLRIGGAGTPMVQDLCLHELAVSRQAHPMATRFLAADALDLIHRLPKCWAVVEALKCEAWVARRIAKLTRDLSAEDAAYVDAAVAETLAGEQPSIVLEAAEAKVIEANPELHEQKIREERRRRFVSLGRMDEAGLRHVVARVEHGDAVWFNAMIGRVADILATRDKAEGLPARSRDVRRAEAFGWLARPAELLALLLDHSDQSDPGPAETDHSDVAGEGADCEAGGEGVDGESEPEEPSRADSWHAGFPARLLDTLRSIDPAKLRPRATVYVHLHQAALASSRPTGRGVVVKAENGGPLLPEHLAPMLGSALVQVTEVIDLNGVTPLATYVHPQWLKDQVQLISPRTGFPHSTTISRSVDYDHPVPYRHDRAGPSGATRETGPSQSGPKQTGLHNSAPLSRSQHRAKTHAGYTVRIPKPGTLVWRTPHHRFRLVTPTGTTVVDEMLGRALVESQSPLERQFALLIAEHPPAA